jgi:hypothetical protein
MTALRTVTFIKSTGILYPRKGMSGSAPGQNLPHPDRGLPNIEEGRGGCAGRRVHEKLHPHHYMEAPAGQTDLLNRAAIARLTSP